MEAPDRGVEAADAVAGLIGPVLGWDEATMADEVKRYRADVRAQRAAEAQPDDASAVAALTGVVTATP